MNAINQAAPRPAVLTIRKVILFILGGIAGAASGAGLMLLLKQLGVSLKTVSYFDILCTMIAAFFMALGAVQGGMALNRKQLGRMLEGGDSAAADDIGEKIPATDSEVRIALQQAAVLFLAGVLMLLPIAALGPMQTHTDLGGWVFAAIFLLFLVQTALNIRVWQRCDEFVRGAILTMCALTFAISQSLLFLWAAAEHLHLLPALSSWNIFTLLMTCYILVNTYISIRLRR